MLEAGYVLSHNEDRAKTVARHVLGTLVDNLQLLVNPQFSAVAVEAISQTHSSDNPSDVSKGITQAILAVAGSRSRTARYFATQLLQRGLVASSSRNR
jgi:hypothetical protein